MIKFPSLPETFLSIVRRFNSEEPYKRYQLDYNGVIQKEFDARTPDTSSRDSVYISSPDGSIWQVTVDDAGAVSAAKVLG